MDFIVVKVNGRDVSKARHEEAVEAFRTAKEPIVVEVLRRTPSIMCPIGKEEKKDNNAPSNATSPTLCDTCTQTEWTGGWTDPNLPTNGSSVLHSSPIRSLLDSDVLNHYRPLVAQEGEEEECEVEYEEVTLTRSLSSEKLGLTLCYGAPDDSDTDIYVSEVEPSSVAGKDGRILEGDQLLQINGIEVRNREQAVSLFSEKRSDVTLLVARPHQGVVEDEDDDDDNSDLCRSHNALIEEDEVEEEEDAETAGHHEKDSGVGRTDESTKNEESSEENPEGTENTVVETDTASAVAQEDTVSAMDCERFREQLELKCASTSTTNLDSIIIQPGENKTPVHRNHINLKQQAGLSRHHSDASLDREMALLNQEMQNIQLECESLVHRHMSDSQKKPANKNSRDLLGDQLYVNLADWQNQMKSSQQSLNKPTAGEDGSDKPRSRFQFQALSKKEAVERWVKSMVFGRGRHPSGGTSSSPVKQANIIEGERDSAYNTGGSTPLTLELSPLVSTGPSVDKRATVVSHHGSMMSLVSPRMEDKGTQLQESDVASIFSCDSCRRCCRALLQQQSESPLYHDVIRRRLSPDLNNSRHSVSSFHQGSNRRHRAASDEGSSRGLGAKEDQLHSEKNKNYVTFQPAGTPPTPTTMYTNQANLQHTIWLQQQLFRDALAHNKRARHPGLVVAVPPPHPFGEWKLEGRVAGVSYISFFCPVSTII